MGNPLTAAPLRAARWSARHPWRAILAWVVLVLVAVGCASAFSTRQTTDADYRIGESGRAEALIARAGLAGGDTESVLLTARDGSLDVAAARTVAAELRDRAGDLSEVASVGAPVVGEDRSAVLVPVELAPGIDDVDEIAGLRAAVSDVRNGHPDLRVRESGELTVNAAVDDRVGSDLGSAEVTSLPVTLVLMLVAFGALIAAGIPVLLAATSVAATIGLMAPLSHLIYADSTTTSMVVLIGMAVGVDYSLFYLKREREERLAGRSTRDAVDIAAATSGHSILVSGGAVIAALAGLFVVDDATFNSLAAGSIVVVAVAVLGSITVLPALLVKLGRWVDRPRVPLLWRLTRESGGGRFSARLLRPVLRRPVAAVILAGVVVGALAVPALGLRTHSATIDTLPRDIPEVVTYCAIAKAFPSDGDSVVQVVLRTDGATGTAQGVYDRLVAGAVATGHFVAPSHPVRTSHDGRTSVLTLGMSYGAADDRVPGLIRDLRTDLLPQALVGETGVVEHAVGGDPAARVDYSDNQSGRLLLVIGFVLALTMLIMVLTFRSVVLGLLSTVLNLASVGAAFGVMTLVFQHGWFESALGFHSPGFVIDWLPLFVLVVLVGLSMDYHVFVISRVREYVDRGLPTRLAVEKGIAGSAGVVTSAAAVMVSVFAIFASLSMLEMKTMGVALAVAILLDATLVRLVLLPAALVLLGDRAWWPRRRPAVQGAAVLEPDPAYGQVVG